MYAFKFYIARLENHHIIRLSISFSRFLISSIVAISADAGVSRTRLTGICFLGYSFTKHMRVGIGILTRSSEVSGGWFLLEGIYLDLIYIYILSTFQMSLSPKCYVSPKSSGM